MADGICDWDAERPHARNHIITRLSPPASVELCDEHYGPGLIPLLADELGVEPGPFYAHVEKYLKREAIKADRALADAQAGAAAEGSEGPAGEPAVADTDTIPGPEGPAVDPYVVATGQERPS